MAYVRYSFCSSSIAMKCPELEKPMNGRIEVKQPTFGAKAEYSCNDGFDMTGGNRVRQCMAAGSWSGRAPSCQCKAVHTTHTCRHTYIRTHTRVKEPPLH